MSSLGATGKLSLPSVLALALGIQAAAGQAQDPDRIACADPSPQIRIQACSVLLKAARASDLDTPVAYNNRGLAYSETGQHELAIQDFNQAIAIFPSYAIAYSNRGLARENIGQMKEALADFDQALKLNPDYAAAYNNRCYVKAVLGDLNAALADCQKAVSLLPEDAKTLDSLAYVYFRLGQYQQAIQQYNEALKRSPNLLESLYGRGAALIKVGDASGNKDLEEAAKADPAIADRMAKLGITR